MEPRILLARMHMQLCWGMLAGTMICSQGSQWHLIISSAPLSPGQRMQVKMVALRSQ